MSYIGGTPRSLKLDSQTFNVTGESKPKVFLGGVTNEVKANGDKVTGRILVTAVPWSIKDIVVAIDNGGDTAEALEAIKERAVPITVTVEYADGTIYSGMGQITGENETDLGDGSMSLTLMGPGKLTKQTI